MIRTNTKSTVNYSDIVIESVGDGSYQLTTDMFVPLPRAEVFDFFADATQLERITPPWLNFSILTPAPINLKAGALIDYRLKLRFIPVKWRTEICVWQPPIRFVDQQLRGPYKRWYHEHTFKEVDGGTLVEDSVNYRVPGGSLVHRFFVKPDLLKIFKFRQDTLQEIFTEKIQQRRQTNRTAVISAERDISRIPTSSRGEFDTPTDRQSQTN